MKEFENFAKKWGLSAETPAKQEEISKILLKNEVEFNTELAKISKANFKLLAEKLRVRSNWDRSINCGCPDYVTKKYNELVSLCVKIKPKKKKGEEIENANND